MSFFFQHGVEDSLGKKAETAVTERQLCAIGNKINFNYIPKLRELVLSINQKIMRIVKWYL